MLNEWCLFFDGASKGNPGQAGGGGIIFEPTGKIHLSYAWGLGHASNNQAEILVLWKGLIQARNLNIQKINIFGDSKLIIKAVHTKKIPSDIHLGQIFRKVSLLLSHFRIYKAQHVLRNLNSLADAEANQGVLLTKTRLLSMVEAQFTQSLKDKVRKTIKISSSKGTKQERKIRRVNLNLLCKALAAHLPVFN